MCVCLYSVILIIFLKSSHDKCLGTDHRTFVTVQRPSDVTSNKSWQGVIKIHEFIPYLQAKAPVDDYHESFSAHNTKSLMQTLVILFPCTGMHFCEEPALPWLYLFSPSSSSLALQHMCPRLISCIIHKIKQGIAWTWKHLARLRKISTQMQLPKGRSHHLGFLKDSIYWLELLLNL